MADDDALIATAAHVLLPYLSYTDDDFPDEAARAVVAVVLDDVHGRLRAAIAETSIYDQKITGLLHAAEVLGVPDAEDVVPASDPAKRYLDRLELSRPSPEVQEVIDRLRKEGQ